MSNKITLHTKASSVLFSRAIEIAPKTILCNDIVLPGDYNPYNIRLWIVGNASAVLGAAWASCEQHALDAIVDAGLGGCFLIDEKDADERTCCVGNGDDPADLSRSWLAEVEFLPERDLEIIKRFDELRHSDFETLEI